MILILGSEKSCLADHVRREKHPRGWDMLYSVVLKRGTRRKN